MKRSARLVPKRRPDVAALDKLCREVVRRRDRGRCCWCGKAGTDWAHVHGRRSHSLRWRLENSMMLCRTCHARWHAHPWEAAQWWEEKFPERMRVLASLRTGVGRPDLAAIRSYLEHEMQAVPTGRPVSAGVPVSSEGPPAMEEP
jgi:hypothetical protein